MLARADISMRKKRSWLKAMEGERAERDGQVRERKKKKEKEKKRREKRRK